ncbi:MAG: acetate kinase, partial [Mycobacterium sp.]|nr:acetate kinase [Mycobacterium sp.]
PTLLARARIARLSDGRLVVEVGERRTEKTVSGAPLAGVISGLSDAGLPVPDAIGHRFVHGGDYDSAQLLSAGVLAELTRLTAWAPQHQPAALGGVAEVEKHWPGTRQVGCFDSAFHRTMPEVAQRLPLPSALWDEGVRRYGFHGLSYQHIVDTVGAAALGRAIVAHLGNGTSMAAIHEGRSLDTTMCFTPDAGLFMGSRSGDVDPGLLLYLATRDDRPLSMDELRALLQEESGLRGLSGGESDMQRLLARSDADARLAIDSYCRQTAKQVGAFASVLGGVDTLVFTGGIGEHSADIRDDVVGRLGFLAIGQVLVIPTDEEAVIARQTAAVLAQPPAH